MAGSRTLNASIGVRIPVPERTTLTGEKMAKKQADAGKLNLDNGEALSKALGRLASRIRSDTGAPIVIIVCMGGLTAGSVVSAVDGCEASPELATALRRAADVTDHVNTRHVHRVVDPEPS